MPATADIIFSYFPALSEKQKEQFRRLDALYREWNAQINVISRKDIDNLYVHHVLHSLAPAKVVSFRPGTSLLDVGTGGGFPGIPLAIAFPECRFKLIDGTGKKITVVDEVIKATGLENCMAEQIRGEQETGKYDFVVSRAAMTLPELARMVKKNIKKKQANALPNGLICLKGGKLDDEVAPFRSIVEITPVDNWFGEEWFKGKNVVYLPL